MRTKRVAFVALVVALVLGMAAIASGGTAPVLTASKTALTYPHTAMLYSNTPGTIMQRIAGASEWTTAPVSVNPTVTIKPKATAAYKLVVDGAESEPVTITVAAQLSKPQVNKHGHRWHKLTIKGWVSPMHRTGDVQLTFFHWEKTGTKVVVNRKGKTKTINKYEWVQKGDAASASLHRWNSSKSKWAYRWTPSMKGTWKVVVSHEDVEHVYSSASMKTLIKR